MKLFIKIRQFIATMVYIIYRKKCEIDHIEEVKSLYPED